ncbi:MAG: hypothetical protein A3I78_06275 [Gammaproteobacteria bacterium RIFCSPLOWO2_02_FULL_56_15]|nr:MAG: hypothetical protein A3I78_06275 [Gammaproteobacteria bacterium RIFCSPLOWO2_02_FULL_56_15]
MKEFVPKPGRPMDQVREVLRFYHHAYSTEKVYVQWILRYLWFNDRRHQNGMGKSEIEWFLFAWLSTAMFPQRPRISTECYFIPLHAGLKVAVIRSE